MIASRAMALTAIELLRNPTVLAQAKSELVQRRGEHFKYAPLFGNRPPPIDYRVKKAE